MKVHPFSRSLCFAVTLAALLASAGRVAVAHDPGSHPADVIVPSTITANDVFQVTVKMDRRQVGSTVVTLSTNNSSALSIPATVTVPNNNIGVTFNATALASATGVTITATANGVSATETFDIN